MVMIIVGILFVPFVAMQITSDVNWKLADFILMAGLMLGAGLLGEFIYRKVKNIRDKAVICIMVLLFFLLIWVELAVGVFGTPFAGS